MSVWRWPSARWGVTVLTVHQGERADRATVKVNNPFWRCQGIRSRLCCHKKVQTAEAVVSTTRAIHHVHTDTYKHIAKGTATILFVVIRSDAKVLSTQSRSLFFIRPGAYHFFGERLETGDIYTV